MNDGIILRTSPEFTALCKNLLQAIERLDGLLAELRPSIRSETYLTSEEAVSYTHLTLPTTSLV